MIPYKNIFIKLAEEKIEYLVTGGVAVNLHQVNRSTIDLDLVLHLEQENVLAFIKVMEHLGYRPRLPVTATDFADSKTRQFWIEKKNRMVFSFIHPKNPMEIIDIFVKEPKPFDDLKKRSVAVKAFGVIIPVMGIDDIIDLKKEAGRETDLFDIRQLEAIKNR